MKTLKLLLVLIFVSPGAFATNETGLIKNILVNTSRPNVVMIIVDGGDVDKPGCVDGNIWEWGIDISTETGKAMYSLALTSYASQKPVFVFGANVCTHTGIAENVVYLHTSN